MKNDKSKLIIVGVLFLVIIGVGAFQMFGGSKPSAAPPKSTASTPTTKPDSASPGGASPKSVPTPPGSVADMADSHIDAKNSTNTMHLESGQTEPNGTAGATNTTLASNPLNSKMRDPFAKPGNIVTADSNRLAQPGGITPGTQPKDAGAPKAGTSPSDSAPKRNPAPVDPMQGGTLPAASGGTQGGSAVAIKPLGPAHRLKGVIEGKLPLAIIEDREGHQRIVRIGEQFDTDTTVEKIQKGKVILNEKGKEVTLTLEDKPQ